jgi:hypothetical protein
MVFLWVDDVADGWSAVRNLPVGGSEEIGHFAR